MTEPVHLLRVEVQGHPQFWCDDPNQNFWKRGRYSWTGQDKDATCTKCINAKRNSHHA